MANISLAEAARLRDRVQRFQNQTKKAREKAGEIVTEVVRTGEVALTAGAIGYFQGKRAAEGKDPLALFGVPLDLAVGVLAKGLAISGVGGNGAEEHFKAVGDGAIATYFSTLGFTAGKQGLGIADTIKKSLGAPKVSGQSLTAEELATLATA